MAERVVRNPKLTYRMTDDQLQRYVAQSSVSLRTFLKPGQDHYVVIAVDPSAGGVNSEEAFTVFLTSGADIALLSGRVVSGRSPDVHFSMLPLTFVLALLDTVKKCRRLLQSEHATASHFQMPPVLVVVETNFAYGAAVYMQMMYFVEARRPHRSLWVDTR